MTIRDIIVDSGRWDFIAEYIGEVLKISSKTHPVNMYYLDDYVKAANYVHMKDVREGISHWLMLIDRNIENLLAENAEKNSSIMRSFSMFVDSELDMRLHNVAVDLSHKKDVEAYKIEVIRALSILNSSIDYITCELYLDIDDGNFIPFSIPSGWKKGGD